MSARTRMYQILETAQEHDRPSRIVDIALVTLISLSVAAKPPRVGSRST